MFFFFQNVIQHTTTVQSSANSLPSSHLINIPTYSFPASTTSSSSFFDPQQQRGSVYTPNIAHQQQDYHYTPTPSNMAYNNNSSSSGGDVGNYSPLYAANPEPSYSPSNPTYMEATPLSPDSHQGFTDLSINANTLNDLGNYFVISIHFLFVYVGA